MDSGAIHRITKTIDNIEEGESYNGVTRVNIGNGNKRVIKHLGSLPIWHGMNKV